jgi:hypothetical protein
VSNALAIAAVSAAFLRRVLAAANRAVPQAKVRLGAPTAKLAEEAKPLVNLHLFRVEPNAAHVNNHLPSRNSTGQSRGPSRLSLDLHYVMSFYGDHESFEPDRMVAEVMLSLDHEPLLSRSTISNALGDNDEIASSDLSEAVARLRVSRQLMTLDDLSKIWSVLYQVPYALSLVYEIDHLEIETAERPSVPIPVARPEIWVSPLASLRLDSAGATPERTMAPVWGGTLQVRGQGLAMAGLSLEVDGTPLTMTAVERKPTMLVVPLDATTFAGAELGIGVHRLQAVAPSLSPGQPDQLRIRSNALAFAISPAIAIGGVDAPGGGATATGTVTIAVTPAVGSGQTVRLLLDCRDPAQPSQWILPGRDPQVGGQPETSLTFPFSDLPRGDYLVRADVDGLLSPVVIDTNSTSSTRGQIIGPEITL